MKNFEDFVELSNESVKQNLPEVLSELIKEHHIVLDTNEIETSVKISKHVVLLYLRQYHDWMTGQIDSPSCG
ncbi:hypothetical protein LJC49_09220 [Ruminococcaceae bacterium OttesenSCG-928-I18]|nr:hypothetical protein [Ruminococcaceae bacterium OttesenSCG-928-I18]